jgi:predicted nucleic acid-binding Zn ribbon protein
MKKCPVCGKDFTPRNPKGKVCSAGCRKKAERARKEIVKYETEKQVKKIIDALKEVEDIKSGKRDGKSMDEFLSELKDKPKAEIVMSKYDLERRMKKCGF